MAVFFILISCQFALGLISLSESMNYSNTTESLINFEETSIRNRIIGGWDAQQEQYPYMVSLRILYVEKKGFGRGHFCGGTILTNISILTAAHCMSQNGKFIAPENIIVVAGNIQLYLVQNTTQIRRVTAIVRHPEYSKEDYSNDVAILFLNEPLLVDFKNVAEVSLQNDTAQKTSPCVAIGWGVSDETKNASRVIVSAILKAVDLMITGTDYCKHVFQTKIKPGMFCAGQKEGNKDTCEGDSGGPLVCDNYLTGIISIGLKCGFPNIPGIYINVTEYLPWIEAKINDWTTSAATNHKLLHYFKLIFIPQLIYHVM